MKSFLYKYAEYIFWGIVLLNALNLFTGDPIRAINAILLVIPYFVFKSTSKDRWFLTYFSSFVLNGIFYFILRGLTSNDMMPQIISAFILGLGSFIIYKFVYVSKGNKLLSWIAYFMLVILCIYTTRFF